MKNALLLAVLGYSTITQAQQKANPYEKVFSDFVRYYNTVNPDSMARIFKRSQSWTKDALEKQNKEWGKIVGFKYIGPFKNEVDVEGNQMMYFKVSFDKKTNSKDVDLSVFNGKDIHAAAIALNNDTLIAGHALFTTSESIDSLIREY